MKIKELNNQNFNESVLNNENIVLVDFWAPWCGPCRMLGPTIEELAEEYEGKVAVGKVNVDEEENLAREFGISSIPLVIIFKNGKIEEKLLGNVIAFEYTLVSKVTDPQHI